MSVVAKVARSPWYWLALVILGLSMEATALYYQYRLHYQPCVLCIHARIWVMGFIVLGLVAMPLCRWRLPCAAAHGLTAVLAAGLLERAWRLLGTERGTLEASCEFDSGLPPWFALDQWFPQMFQVLDACGYTPKVLIGITMAEGLVLISTALLLAALVLAAAIMIRRSPSAR
jgi:disulfide bond formation protein DsbB